MRILMFEKLSKYKTIIKASISLIFIYILFSKFIQASSFELIRHMGPGTLLICLALSFLSLVFKSMRWKTMIEMVGGKINFLNLVELYLIGFYYGSISPGRAGEFVKGSRLSNNGLQTKKGLISILYERFYDIATPIAFVSIYYITYAFLHKEVSSFLLLLGTYLISIVLWIGMIHAFQLFKKRIQFLKNIDDICLTPTWRYTFMPATASILNWACIGLSAFVLLESFNVRIDFPHTMFAVCIAMLSLLIPMTINGWGIREAAFVWALSPFAEPSQSIVFSITFSLIGTYSLALLGLLCEMRGRGDDGALQGRERN